ncbi:5-hydroxytryptamine receptor 3A-like [Amphiprion ocellaris]|uniref:5-hydroxytryptamine receptor 3A-like n=1 Tax=Amphiprion ocellaris TaxID=80972 RepID=UPI002410DC47|nr:5-hydroxytryptamine receptor 3A-like [Amphiprion ocellaris]
MMLAGFLFFLPLLTDGKPSSAGLPDDVHDHEHESSNISEEIPGNEVNRDANCSFQAVMKYLNLTKDNPKYTLNRPVKDHSSRTEIYIAMMIYAILDVRESDQAFVTYLWIFLKWNNEHIRWSPGEFCGLEHIIVPTYLLWLPDVIIEDMIDGKVISSPYLYINYKGSVEYRIDQVVTSTCKMTGYKFPFDIQTCNLTFKSLMHSDKDIELISNENSTEITEWSREVMRSQYEWLFVSLTVAEKTVYNKTKILYVITMKRRSILYVANFLLPVFFFLCLDLASLLISNRGGEKLSFKVTVLLAVTVMQLILNEILPTSTDRIPLIAIYCIGVFGMMMLSLMETIFVTYLMEKDFQDDETDGDQSLNEIHEDKLDKGNFHSCFRGIKKCVHCASANDASADETSVPKEGSSQLTEVSLALEKVSDELGEIDRKMIQLSSNKEEKSGYWTRMAKKIDKAFSIIYVISASMFLVILFSIWSIPYTD